jgi:hypothetical protein
MADVEKPVAAPAESANAPAQIDAPKPAEAKTGSDAPAASDEKPETPAAGSYFMPHLVQHSDQLSAVAGAADDADASMIDASAVGGKSASFVRRV